MLLFAELKLYLSMWPGKTCRLRGGRGNGFSLKEERTVWNSGEGSSRRGNGVGKSINAFTECLPAFKIME